jgi:hypothetical protein
MTIWGSHYLRPDQMPAPHRQEALLRITPAIVLDLLLNLNRDRRITIDGVPPDSTVVLAGYEVDMDSFVLRLHSEEFEPVAEGAAFPFLNPMFTDHGPWNPEADHDEHEGRQAPAG